MSNLLIEANICRAAHRAQAKRLIFLGSSCIYPRDCPQPIREEYLLTGPLEATNRPYALAKIAGIEMCWSYNRQYGTKWLAAMPTNLYGPGDNYDLNSSHVLPALIRKFHLAKLAQQGDLGGIKRDEAMHGKIPDDVRAMLGIDPQPSALSPQSSVIVWGSGTPKREFLYVDDLANALVYLAMLEDGRYDALVAAAQCPLINVGTGADLTIRELAETVAGVVGYKGKLLQDTSKPDGTMRKVMDVSKIQGLGWKATTSLKEGISLTYKIFSELESLEQST
jgi:GDP-L-fucose synthase